MSTISNGPGAESERLGGLHDEAPGTEKLAEHAHRGIDHAAAEAADAERELRRAAAHAADRIRQSEAELADMLDENLRKVRAYIEKNPIQSAGIAFAAGVVLSSLLRR